MEASDSTSSEYHLSYPALSSISVASSKSKAETPKLGED
jgi:hypothetical protein